MPPTVAGSSNGLNSHVLPWLLANVIRATMALLSFVRQQATNWQRIESICYLDCTLFRAMGEFLMIGSFSKVALTEDRQWYQPSAVCWALSGLRCVHISWNGQVHGFMNSLKALFLVQSVFGRSDRKLTKRSSTNCDFAAHMWQLVAKFGNTWGESWSV